MLAPRRIVLSTSKNAATAGSEGGCSSCAGGSTYPRVTKPDASGAGPGPPLCRTGYLRGHRGGRRSPEIGGLTDARAYLRRAESWVSNRASEEPTMSHFISTEIVSTEHQHRFERLGRDRRPRRDRPVRVRLPRPSGRRPFFRP